jgi:hypothetical protein
MADTFQGSVAERLFAAARERMAQFYRDQGYTPAQAAIIADHNLRDRMSQDQGAKPVSETASPAPARPSLDELNRPEPGYSGAQGRLIDQAMYRVTPRMLAQGEPAPEMDRFDETPIGASDQRNVPILSKAPTTPSTPPQSAPSFLERALSVVRRPASPPDAGAPFNSSEMEIDPASGLSFGNRAVPAPPPSSAAVAPSAPVISPHDLFDMRAPPVSPDDLFDMRAVPLPPPRPANLGMQAPARRPAPVATPPAQAPAAQSGNMLSRLFSGPDVQSNSQAVSRFEAQSPSQMGPGRGTVRVNWGNAGGPEGSAADLIRADQAMRAAQSAGHETTGLKHGGAAQAPGKDAALHKALEIIHHMITRGR